MAEKKSVPMKKIKRKCNPLGIARENPRSTIAWVSQDDVAGRRSGRGYHRENHTLLKERIGWAKLRGE